MDQGTLAFFLAATGCRDEGLAFCLLEESQWNTQEAIQKYSEEGREEAVANVLCDEEEVRTPRVMQALAAGMAWEELGDLKGDVRGLKYNKSSWGRALKEAQQTQVVSEDPIVAICSEVAALAIEQALGSFCVTAEVSTATLVNPSAAVEAAADVVAEEVTSEAAASVETEASLAAEVEIAEEPIVASPSTEVESVAPITNSSPAPRRKGKGMTGGKHNNQANTANVVLSTIAKATSPSAS